MKVLYIITRSERGGAQMHLMSLIEAFPSGDKPILAVGAVDVQNGIDYLVNEARNIGIEVHILPSLVVRPSIIRDTRSVFDIVSVIRKECPDLIHLHSSKAGLLGRLAGFIAGKPTVFTAHGWAFTDGVSVVRKITAVISEHICARLTNVIIAVSQYDTSLARRWGVGRAEQIVTIENGIQDLPLQREHGEEEVVRVIMTARFAAPKNQRALLYAVEQIPNLEVWLVGDGPQLPETRALAKELNLSTRVHFLGSRSDVPQLLAKADIFALISDYEGFPMSTLEAMRAGLPVIVSDVGGAGEAVSSGVNGFVVPKGDNVELVRVLKLLINDSGLRKSMGDASRARFLARYQVGDMVKRTFSVYKTVLTRHAKLSR